MATSDSNNSQLPPSGKQISGGAVWSIAERISTQGVTFIVTLIMARILTPEDFGLIGMLTIFVELGATLATSGLAHALIKNNGGTPAQNGSVLLFNIICGTLLYLLVWLCAPLIAGFYEIPSLTRLARMIAVVIPLRAVSTIMTAHLLGRMEFKRMAIASLVALILSGCVGIAASVKWRDVDAIVAFQVANALFTLIALTLSTIKTLRLDFNSPLQVRNLLSFGANISGAAIADFIYSNSYLMAIGKLMPASDVGYFSRSRQFASVPPISIAVIIRKVAYPALCRYGDDHEKMVETTVRILRIVMYITLPLMFTIALNADSIVLSLLGEKWSFSAGLLSILCIGTVVTPIDSVNLTLLPAGGYASVMLKVEIARKIVGIVALILSLPFGITGICVGYVVASYAALLLCLLVSKNVFGILIRKQLGAIFPFVFPTYIACRSANLLASLVDNSLVSMTIGCLGAAILYLGITRLFNYPELRDINTAIRKFIKRKNEE